MSSLSVSSSGCSSNRNIYYGFTRIEDKISILASLICKDSKELFRLYISFYLAFLKLPTQNSRLAEMGSDFGQEHIAEFYSAFGEECNDFVQKVCLCYSEIEKSLSKEREHIATCMSYACNWASDRRARGDQSFLGWSDDPRLVFSDIVKVLKSEQQWKQYLRVKRPQEKWVHVGMRECLSRICKIYIAELTHRRLCKLALCTYWLSGLPDGLDGWVDVFISISEASCDRVGSLSSVIGQCMATLKKIEERGQRVFSAKMR